MTEFLTMWAAYEALLSGRLAVGQLFMACSRPGYVFLVHAASKIRVLANPGLEG